MLKNIISVSVLASTLVFITGSALAADQDRDRLKDQDRLDQDQTKDQDRLRDQDRIYGSQLMTQKEREQYNAQMQSAKTEQEREQIRNQHQKSMNERAKERGVNIPDVPPARSGGMGGGMMNPGGGR